MGYNWINSVVDAYKDSESPQRFYYWAAITAMAAVMRKNIYLDRFHYKLYPNIYVFLIAKSGMKKGIPISLCKSLVEKSEASKVISGRNSVPRVIYDLGKLKTNANGTVPYKEAQALIISGELASFLVKDLDGLKVLTDLYNTHEHEEKWENSLKSTGIDTLTKPCINLFGATNDDHFAETIPKSDVKGGFIARTFIVYSMDRGLPNPLVDPPSSIIDVNSFVPYLKDLAKLKGEFKWTKETADWYKTWYIDFMQNLPENDVTGYYNRVGDSILKVAMILSLSKRLDLTMDLDALQEAKAECMNCGLAAHQISMGGSATLSGQTRIVIRALLSHPEHKISRTQLLKRYWGDINGYDLDLVIENLLGAGMIEVKNIGKDRIYVMKDAVVNEYLIYEKKVRGV